MGLACFFADVRGGSWTYSNDAGLVDLWMQRSVYASAMLFVGEGILATYFWYRYRRRRSFCNRSSRAPTAAAAAVIQLEPEPESEPEPEPDEPAAVPSAGTSGSAVPAVGSAGRTTKERPEHFVYLIPPLMLFHTVFEDCFQGLMYIAVTIFQVTAGAATPVATMYMFVGVLQAIVFLVLKLGDFGNTSKDLKLDYCSPFGAMARDEKVGKRLHEAQRLDTEIGQHQVERTTLETMFGWFERTQEKIGNRITGSNK